MDNTLLPDWNTIKGYIQAFGWTKGVFTIFFFAAHVAIYKMYIDRLNDKQQEIERLAADNRQYRDRFLKFYDEKFDYKPKQKGGKR